MDLVAKLKLVDTFPEDLAHLPEIIENVAAGYRELGYHIPHIEIKMDHKEDAMRSLIEGYMDNPVLIDAISNKRSIEDSLLELDIYKGLRIWFPPAAPEWHYGRLQQLGKLITPPTSLDTDFHVPDSLVSGCLYGVLPAAAAFVVGAVASICGEGMGDAYLEGTKYLAMFSIPFFGITLPLVHRSGSLPLEEARYLDTKIKELY